MCLLLSGELVSALTCHPEYKLLSVSSVPQMPTSSIAYSSFSWPALLKPLRQMLVSNAQMDQGKSTGHHPASVCVCVWVSANVRCVPGTGIDWEVCPGSGRTAGRRFNASLANLLVLRGKDASSADTGETSDRKSSAAGDGGGPEARRCLRLHSCL